MSKNILFVIYAVDFIDNFGIAMLSAVAKKCGWHTFLEVFHKNTIDDTMARIQPNLVCYSVMSSDADIYAEINRRLKSRHDFVSIMGGPHPTFFPNFIHEDGVDFICRGEGEKAFATFLEKYERGESCEDVPNFATKQQANPGQVLSPIKICLCFPGMLVHETPDVIQSPVDRNKANARQTRVERTVACLLHEPG